MSDTAQTEKHTTVMEDLPNEIHVMIASYLPKGDLPFYRFIKRRYEAIGARYLFETVKYNLTWSPQAAIRPIVAQHVTRLHLDTYGIDESSIYGPKRLERLIRDLSSASANITELRLRTSDERKYPDGRRSRFINDYLEVLSNSAPLLKNVTTFVLKKEKDNKALAVDEEACIALYTFLSSLEKATTVGIIINFEADVGQDHVDRLWQLYWPSCQAFRCDLNDQVFPRPQHGTRKLALWSKVWSDLNPCHHCQLANEA
jgi:hypothetical protein